MSEKNARRAYFPLTRKKQISMVLKKLKGRGTTPAVGINPIKEKRMLEEKGQ